MEYVISIDTIKADTNKIVVKETTADFHYLGRGVGQMAQPLSVFPFNLLQSSPSHTFFIHPTQKGNARFFGQVGFGTLTVIPVETIG